MKAATKFNCIPVIFEKCNKNWSFSDVMRVNIYLGTCLNKYQDCKSSSSITVPPAAHICHVHFAKVGSGETSPDR